MKRGFSLAEVLICLAIMTAGFLPVFRMYQSTTKKGGLSEFHIFFQARAIRITEFYSSYNYDAFRNALLAAGGIGAKVELPIEGKIVEPALPTEYLKMLANGKFDETCTIQFEEGASVDLVRLTVEIRWKFPLDTMVHTQSLCRLFKRPDITEAENEIVFSPDVP